MNESCGYIKARMVEQNGGSSPAAGRDMPVKDSISEIRLSLVALGKSRLRNPLTSIVSYRDQGSSGPPKQSPGQASSPMSTK